MYPSRAQVNINRHIKFKINEVSCKLFLKKFYHRNALGDSSNIQGIINDLHRILLDDATLELIKKSLDSVIECVENEAGYFQDVYSNLMCALSNDNVMVSRYMKTPYLSLLYRSIFDNDLDLVAFVSNKCGIVNWYGVDGNQCPDMPCKERFKKMLGEKTFGIFDADGKTISYYGLSHPESGVNKLFNGVLGVNYAPQFYNNIPYVYESKLDASRRLRIGAQIQQFLGVACVPAVFKNFLLSIERDQNNPNSINYLYINLQKTLRDDKRNNLQRYFEANRSNVLHDQLSSIPGVQIVTLPADNSNFFKGFDIHQGKAMLHFDDKNNFEKLKDFFDEVCFCILNNAHDFRIPLAVKNKIFNNYNLNSDAKIELLEILYIAAAEILGDNYASENSMISMEQRQAIYFHFVKHKFTQLIVSKLKPKFFNISCKDAIDRAGVHNLWNILCCRIENDVAMTLYEFETLLNMPALLVKERPINDHVNVLANVLGHYYYHLSNNKKLLIPWAPEWLKNNSVYKGNAENAFTWSYAIDKSKKDYNISHGVYNELYIAVNSADLLEVARILDSNVSVDIYDNSYIKKDSILICAAKKGHFDIFLYLMSMHEMLEKKSGYLKKNPLHGLRGWHPLNTGTALNYLLEHLETQDVDVEDETVTAVDECILVYLESIFKTKSTLSRIINLIKSEDFAYYTNQADEEGLTPIMRLAKTGNHVMLKKLAQICENNNYHISTVFDLRNTTVSNKNMMQYAAEFKHEDFINVLFELTKEINVYARSEYNKAIYKARSTVVAQLFL